MENGNGNQSSNHDEKCNLDDSTYYDYEKEVADRQREWLDDLADDARWVNCNI